MRTVSPSGLRDAGGWIRFNRLESFSGRLGNLFKLVPSDGEIRPLAPKAKAFALRVSAPVIGHALRDEGQPQR